MQPDIAEIARGRGITFGPQLTPEHIKASGLRGSAEDRFWANVDRRSHMQCWLWRGRVSSRGYGLMQTPVSQSSPAHRVSFVLHRGPIEKGMVVDHICRNRLCVNPSHLRQVTPSINSLENSQSVSAINIAKTHCIHGHALIGKNVRTRSNGWRECKSCHLQHQRTWRAKKRSHLLSKDKTDGDR